AAAAESTKVTVVAPNNEEEEEDGFPMEGVTESQIECLSCGFKPRSSRSRFCTLTLPEHIDDYKCEKCRLVHAEQIFQAQLARSTSEEAKAHRAGIAGQAAARDRDGPGVTPRGCAPARQQARAQAQNRKIYQGHAFPQDPGHPPEPVHLRRPGAQELGQGRVSRAPAAGGPAAPEELQAARRRRPQGEATRAATTSRSGDRTFTLPTRTPPPSSRLASTARRQAHSPHHRSDRPAHFSGNGTP
ncbi:hypothetical protein OPQ81_010409, partial [Rhizoctonia solani]